MNGFFCKYFKWKSNEYSFSATGFSIKRSSNERLEDQSQRVRKVDQRHIYSKNPVLNSILCQTVFFNKITGGCYLYLPTDLHAIDKR